MGHFGQSFTEQGGVNNLTKMIVGGTTWVAGGGKKTDCSGTVWPSYHRTVLVADANQPIGIDVSKDGKVYWTEMGLIGAAANQYNSTGAIMMHDQKGAPGNKTTVTSILTRADHGNSEDGVLGFSLQPGFDLSDPNKRHVFAYYSPRPGPGDNWPIAATPAAQVVGYNQISRWTVTADGKSVEPNSERVILRVPKAKIGGSPSGFPGGPTDSGPGHVGGAGLDFDSEGNLYLGVGDDVSPNASGHSGYAPMDYRSAERWDARKTSANTADLRGKVLRIKPTLASIALGLAARHGVDVHDPRGQPVRPRHAEDASRDLRDGLPAAVHAAHRREEPGPDRRRRVLPRRVDRPRQRSPAGTCEWNLVDKAANMGWPFCVGDQSTANTMYKWNYANQTVDERAVRLLARPDPVGHQLRAGGPDAQPGDVPGPRHDPEAPAGDDLEEVHATPVTPGLPNTADFGDLTAGGMQPMAGPIFRYNGATTGSGGFPAYYDGSWLINNRGANDGWWKEVKIRNDNNQMLRVQDWLPYNHAGSATAQQNSLVIGTQFGDDGALYMARYPVTCCRNSGQRSTTRCRSSRSRSTSTRRRPHRRRRRRSTRRRPATAGRTPARSR